MVGILALWLPILLGAVAVFIVSSVLHMVLRYHESDWSALPDEKGVRDALRPFAVPPGEYMFPRAADMKEMNTPEYRAKLDEGPVGMLTMLPNGPFTMSKALVQWFVYCVVVGVITAYIAGRALPPGAHYLKVFQLAGAASFACYVVGGWQASIWYSRRWSTTLKNTFDGLVYALVTAGFFGWLWPGM